VAEMIPDFESEYDYEEYTLEEAFFNQLERERQKNKKKKKKKNRN